MNPVRIAGHVVIALAILGCAYTFRNNPSGRRVLAYGAAFPVVCLLGMAAGVALTSRLRGGGLMPMAIGFMAGGAIGVVGAIFAGGIAVHREPVYWTLHIILTVIVIGWPFVIGG